MKRILVSLFVACLLAAAPTLSAKSKAASLEALRDKDGNIHCTIFSINESEHLWMTALHCVEPLDDYGVPAGKPYDAYLNAEPTQIYKAFPESGVVILYTPRQSAQGYKLDHGDVYYDEPVTMAGHGLGLENITLFHGQVSAINVEDPYSGLFYNFYSMPVCHGHSGSPVLNGDTNRVIGVMQIVLSEGSCGSPSGGTTLPDLIRETGQYWR